MLQLAFHCQSLNVSSWCHLFGSNQKYTRLLDYIEFGWLINYTAETAPKPTFENHHSTVIFDASVQDYINLTLNVVKACYCDHSCWTHHHFCLGTNSTSLSRRVVLDLLWPPTNQSVNAGIPIDCYDGDPFKLHLPGADNLIEHILNQDRGSYLYFVLRRYTIARTYRQIKVDSLDWPFLWTVTA